MALNYRSFAVVDDGNCLQGGCMDSRFAQYNPSATYDDGSCPPVIYANPNPTSNPDANPGPSPDANPDPGPNDEL